MAWVHIALIVAAIFAAGLMCSAASRALTWLARKEETKERTRPAGNYFCGAMDDQGRPLGKDGVWPSGNHHTWPKGRPEVCAGTMAPATDWQPPELAGPISSCSKPKPPTLVEAIERSLRDEPEAWGYAATGDKKTWIRLLSRKDVFVNLKGRVDGAIEARVVPTVRRERRRLRKAVAKWQRNCVIAALTKELL